MFFVIIIISNYINPGLFKDLNKFINGFVYEQYKKNLELAIFKKKFCCCFNSYGIGSSGSSTI